MTLRRAACRWTAKSSRSRRYAASVLAAAPRSAASMSRNSSTSRGSDEGLARAIAIRAPLVLFDEAIGRHRDGDLARLRVDEVGEHEHGAVDEAADDSERHDQPEQARHG